MSNINPDPFTTRPEIEGTFGVVTSTHWIATAVGMGTLEKGGNAFDAGVATAFTLQVVEPHLNGPGGDVPIIVHDVKRGRTEVICGQGPAPAGATIAHYKSRGARDGARHRAAGGLRSRHLRILDAAAARLRHDAAARRAGARDRLCPRRLSAGRARRRPRSRPSSRLFRKHWPTSAAVYLPNGEVPKPGTLFTNKQLSETYARILKEAESARRRSHRADRARAQSLVARLCRRSDRQILPHPGGDGRLGLAAQGRAVRRRHGALAADHRGAADLRLRPLHRLQARRLEPGPGDAAAARAAEGFSSSTGSIRPGRSSSICRSNAPSSLMPTARNSTAIRNSPTSRSRRCCRTPTTTSAAS